MAAEVEHLDSPRILAGTRADLEVTVYRDGTATAPTGTGAVSVVDALGTAVSSGTWTNVGSGVLRYTLSATETANVNELTITWAGIVFEAEAAISVTTRAEVVGDVLFTEADARAYDDAALTSAVTFPDALILAARDRIAQHFTEVLGFNLGRRYGLEVEDGDGSTELWLPKAYHLQELRSVETRASGGQTWTAFSASQLADVLVYPNGRLVRESLGTWPAGRRNIRAAYEAGNPIPAPLKRAALIVLRDQLVGSNIPNRALRQTDEIGTFDLVVAGGTFGKWFGIPAVDSVLSQYRERVPMAG
jgi:hypothetical protein